MRRALVVAAVAAWVGGCVNLSKPRAWRCETTADCGGEWVCLSDRYCHDPSVGAPVECLDSAQCTGGWLCGKERRCRDPQLAGAFECDRDSQCGGGWRCSLERVCVDPATFARRAPIRPPAGPVILHSPWLRSTDALRVSPVLLSDAGELSFSAARRKGTTLEVTSLSRSGEDVAEQPRRQYQLAFTPVDFAVVGDTVLVSDGGAVFTLNPSGPKEVALPPGFAPARLVPLAWNPIDVRPQTSGFGVVSTQGDAVLVFSDRIEVLDGGGYVDLAPFIPDAADAGDLRLVIAAQSDAGSTVTVGSAKPFDLPMEFTVREVRVDQTGVAVRVSPFLQVDEAMSIEASGTSPAQTCGEDMISDFIALGVSPGALVVCRGSGGFDRLLSPGDSFVRLATRSTGVSGGHVRELPQGQLAYSTDLRTEVFDLLPELPVSLGVVRLPLEDAGMEEELMAVFDGARYQKRLAARDDGSSGGLAPRKVYASGSHTLAVVDGLDAVVVEGGFVNSVPSEAPLYVLETPPLGPVIARWLATREGGVLVVSGGDTVSVGTDETQVAATRLKPAPGFPLADWVLRGGTTSTELIEGWAIANNTLFRVTASTPERWKASTVPLSGKDPVNVWFSAEAALVGTTTGEVLLLPARVPVTPPLPEEALSFGERCGTVVATTSDSAWVLSPGADGGEWVPLQLPTDLFDPMVRAAGDHLFVVDADGVVLEVPLTCP